MLDTKKRNDCRFAFLVKMTCRLKPPDADFQKALADASKASLMLFAQDSHYWLHLACQPDRPLSRKFFQETHKGHRVLTSAGVTTTEVPQAQIEPTLKQLATDHAVTGLNEPAVTWLTQNRASTAIVAAVTSHSDPKDSLL